MLAELPRTDIDRHLHMLAARVTLPCRQLLARGAQDPVPNRHDEFALLGHADECPWRHQPPLGMAPADQALHAHNSPVQALLWLVVQFKLVAGDGHLQVVLQLHALVDGDLHLRIKKAQGIAPL